MKINKHKKYVVCVLEDNEEIVPSYLKYLLEFLTGKEGVLEEKEERVFIYRYK